MSNFYPTAMNSRLRPIYAQCRSTSSIVQVNDRPIGHGPLALEGVTDEGRRVFLTLTTDQVRRLAEMLDATKRRHWFDKMDAQTTLEQRRA